MYAHCTVYNLTGIGQPKKIWHFTLNLKKNLQVIRGGKHWPVLPGEYGQPKQKTIRHKLEVKQSSTNPLAQGKMVNISMMKP